MNSPPPTLHEAPLSAPDARGAAGPATSQFFRHAGPSITPPENARPTVTPHASPRALTNQLNGALREGEPGTVRNLVRAGADPNRRARKAWGVLGPSPLQTAIDECLPAAALEALFDLTVPADRRGNPSLMMGDLTRFSVKRRSERVGDSGLHRAVRAQNLPALKLLLREGADKKITNHLKKFPYELAWEQMASHPLDATSMAMVNMLTPPHVVVEKLNQRQVVPLAVLSVAVPLLEVDHAWDIEPQSVAAAFPHMTEQLRRELGAATLAKEPLARVYLTVRHSAQGSGTSIEDTYQIGWDQYLQDPRNDENAEMVKLQTPPDLLVQILNRRESVPPEILKLLIPLLPVKCVGAMESHSVRAVAPHMTRDHICLLNEVQRGSFLLASYTSTEPHFASEGAQGNSAVLLGPHQEPALAALAAREQMARERNP